MIDVMILKSFEEILPKILPKVVNSLAFFSWQP